MSWTLRKKDKSSSGEMHDILDFLDEEVKHTLLNVGKSWSNIYVCAWSGYYSHHFGFITEV